MLTTLRILWFKGKEGLEVPLFYVKDFAKVRVRRVDQDIERTV